MHKTYHIEITSQALEKIFSGRALETIIQANLGQDNLKGQFGHPEYHFDDNSFAAGYAYIAEQCNRIEAALRAANTLLAWQAFGRLIHSAQDFYAHSNYVFLWLEYNSSTNSTNQSVPPEQIDPLCPEILNSPDLISGRIYLPWEILSYLPGLEPIMRRILPADSHTRMNLDTPMQGLLFPYALAAARQRTVSEYDNIRCRITSHLSHQALDLFNDQIG